MRSGFLLIGENRECRCLLGQPEPANLQAWRAATASGPTPGVSERAFGMRWLVLSRALVSLFRITIVR